jgi:hypothetical protein
VKNLNIGTPYIPSLGHKEAQGSKARIFLVFRRKGKRKKCSGFIGRVEKVAM